MLAFYADEHIKRAIVDGLRLRGVDLIATLGQPNEFQNRVTYLPL